MLRNYLAAALRNLIRNRITATIAMLGLGVAAAAAFLIALYVHDEFTYDRWIPDNERIVRITSDAVFPHTVDKLEMAPPLLAKALRNDAPEVDAVTRLASSSVTVGHGAVEFQQKIYWADANFFDVFKIPFMSGDRATALVQPESVVLSRSAAQQIFGREDVVGRALTFNRTFSMNVTGVMKDLPSNTHLDLTIVASGTSNRSNLAAFDAAPTPPNGLPPMAYVYALLRSAAGVTDFQGVLASIVARYPEFRHGGASITLQAEPISQIHLRPARLFEMKASGNRSSAYGFLLIGVLIVALAAANFISISAALAAKRSVEIGIRKVSGALRRDLFRQFMAENVLQVTCVVLFGFAAAWALLPTLNALLHRTISFADTFLWPSIVALIILMIAFIAGGYPVTLLSRLRPVSVLRSDVSKVNRGRLRGIVIGAQFAVLVALSIAAGVVSAQTSYALTDGLRFEKDQVLQITTSCATAFATEVRKLDGVIDAACANSAILEIGFPAPAVGPQGRKLSAAITAVDFGYFEMFGLKPVAGRFFSRDFGGDVAPADRQAAPQPSIVVNEALVRAMGFGSPEDAVGQSVSWSRQRRAAQYNAAVPLPSEIIGVVPDYARGSVREITPPTIFWVDPAMHRILNLKLDGSRVPETLVAIDALWRTAGEPRAIIRSFVDQSAQSIYLDLIRQTQVLKHLTVIAIVIAALGLFGLAIFAAEQRTKEIGIRKSMGATRLDILRLMLWQFAKPVLWANLAAWPIAWFTMRQWLNGFAYRIEMTPWMFIAASALALTIALLTVIGHALLVARAQPVKALRYE